MPNELLFQTILSSLLSSLVGALAVYVFAVRKNSVEKRSSYIEKQLSELYSPLAGYHKRIVAKFHVQSQLSNAADGTWKELCERYHKAGKLFEDHEEKFKPYGALIDYNNQQFREE